MGVSPASGAGSCFSVIAPATRHDLCCDSPTSAESRPRSRTLRRPGDLPAEELPGGDEGADAAGGGRDAVLLGVTDVSRARQVDAVRGRKIQKHSGVGLAAEAGILLLVRAEPPVREGPAQPLIEPREAPTQLGLGDLGPSDPGLVRYDEARVEAGSH